MASSSASAVSLASLAVAPQRPPRQRRRGGRPYVRRDRNAGVSAASLRPDARWLVYFLAQDTPHAPRTSGAYIGATVDMARRLRQHNGVIQGGARRTTRASSAGGTWRIARTVRGFRCKHDALSFEWYATRLKRRSTGRGRDALERSLRACDMLLRQPKWVGLHVDTVL